MEIETSFWFTLLIPVIMSIPGIFVALVLEEGNFLEIWVSINVVIWAVGGICFLFVAFGNAFDKRNWVDFVNWVGLLRASICLGFAVLGVVALRKNWV